MKTILRFAIMLTITAALCLCLGAAAYAEGTVTASGTCGENGNNLTWTLYDTGELVIDGTGKMASYYHNYLPPWNKYCLEIKSAAINDGIYGNIGYVFYGCSNLTDVSISAGVTGIGESAFSGCSSLTSVTIPGSVTSISNYAFSGCSSLISVTIPESVTSIGWYAFSHCSSLTSVTIPEGVTSIGGDAFCYCSGLTSVTIPESVTSIGKWAFEGCSGLTSVTIPESVTSISESAFSGCSSLTSVTIPESVTSIGGSAFSGCSSLTSVTIPESVTSIGGGAFSGCSSLTSVTIPEGVTSIVSSTFRGCSSLTSVTIPESVTGIADWAFQDCSSLTSVTIPEGVTRIGNSAFSGCSSLTSVTIPESVTSIADWAFYKCSKLTDVYYGGSEAQWKLISIEYCNDSLTNAAIHYGLIPQIYTITYDANGGANAPGAQTKTQNVALTLSAVRPTRGNTSLGSYSVRLNPNDGSQSVSILRAARTVSYTFRTWNTKADGSGTDYAPGANYTTDADLTLYAQWDSTTATAAVTLPELARDGALFLGWATSRDAESGVMGEYTPSGNVTLYAIWAQPDLVLPAALATIEAEAFSGGAFRYILVPETVTEIGINAFADCPKLRYAAFLGTETVIDDTAFAGVTNLTIIAPAESSAATWAQEHHVNFIPAA